MYWPGSGQSFPSQDTRGGARVGVDVFVCLHLPFQAYKDNATSENEYGFEVSLIMAMMLAMMIVMIMTVMVTVVVPIEVNSKVKFICWLQSE